MSAHPRAQQIAGHLIARACRRLPPGAREDRQREWASELPAILGDPDIRPAARRIARALLYAADHQRGARKLPGAIPAHRGSSREFLVMTSALAAWLLALGGLISTISVVPELGMDRTLPLAALCAGLPLALWMTRHGRKRLGMAGALAGSALAWLFTLGGLISTISVLPKFGLDRTLGLAALCAGPLLALWMTRRVAAARRRANMHRAQGRTP